MTCRLLRAPSRRRRVRHTGLWSRPDRDRGIAASLLAFNYHVHVQLSAKVKTEGFPGSEVVAGIDGTADVHARADGPVLQREKVISQRMSHSQGWLLSFSLTCWKLVWSP